MDKYREAEGDLFSDDDMRAAEKGSERQVGDNLEKELYQAYSQNPGIDAAHEDLREFIDAGLRKLFDQASDRMMDNAKKIVADSMRSIPDVEERVTRGSNYDPKYGDPIDQFAEETDAFMECVGDMAQVGFEVVKEKLPEYVEYYWPFPIEFEIKEY